MSSPGQFVSQAMLSGWQQGAQEKDARKQYLWEQDIQQKTQQYADDIKAISQRMSLLQKGSPEWNQANDELVKTLQASGQLLHPDKNPGALSKFGHLITDALKITTPVNPQEQQEKKIAPYQAEAGRIEAGIVSPTDQAVQAAQAESAANVARIKAGQDEFLRENPNATPEEQLENFNMLRERYMGGDSTELFKPPVLLNLKDGKQITAQQDSHTGRWYDLNRQLIDPSLIADATLAAKPGAIKGKAFDKATGQVVDKDTGQRYNKDDPNNPEDVKAIFKGVATQGSAPKNRDDKYIAILQKEAAGQPLTDDDKSYKAAYEVYVKKTKVDPTVARAAAYGANRYVPVIDPDDPEQTILMKAIDAANQRAGTPASIAYQTDKAVTRYMTSGAGASNITYFNTAMDHLRLLQQAGDALQNGDLPTFNRLSNNFATATGSPAPTNFDAVKAAVAGEISKTFKGTGATDQEISEVNATINNAQSPDQIQGAIGYYIQLMQGKMSALKGQYDAGRSGRPNFGNNQPPPSDQNPKGTVSIAKAMKLKQNKGKTEDQVKADILAHGYTPIP